MDAPVMVEIDQFDGAGGRPHSGLQNTLRITRKRDDATIVIRIARSMEHVRARNGGNRGFQRCHASGIASL
jgi:hypothetical protein